MLFEFCIAVSVEVSFGEVNEVPFFVAADVGFTTVAVEGFGGIAGLGGIEAEGDDSLFVDVAVGLTAVVIKGFGGTIGVVEIGLDEIVVGDNSLFVDTAGLAAVAVVGFGGIVGLGGIAAEGDDSPFVVAAVKFASVAVVVFGGMAGVCFGIPGVSEVANKGALFSSFVVRGFDVGTGGVGSFGMVDTGFSGAVDF